MNMEALKAFCHKSQPLYDRLSDELVRQAGEIRQAHDIIRVLVDNQLDTGESWPRALEWLERNKP